MSRPGHEGEPDRDEHSELVRYRDLYHTLLSSISEGFCIIEVLFDEAERPVDYRFLELNGAFAEQTGLTDAEGRCMRELRPDHEELWFQVYGRVARTGVPIHFESRAEALGRWYSVDAFRVGDPEEHRVGVLFEDVTERREAEEALREADRRKDEFLAMLAHELRNPLAPIRNAVDLLGLAAPSDTKVERARDLIDRQVGHMTRMIDDLLDVSRIARGAIRLRVERIDLGDVVRETASDYSTSLGSGGLSLSIDVPDEPIWVDGDRTRIAQMVGNLLHNSAKFTGRGGWVRVRAAIDPETGEAVASVEDSGAGLAPELLPRLFDVFSQAEQGLHRSEGGLGLGLALVKGLAELHGGSVAAASPGPGRGATFTLRFPRAAGAGEAAAPKRDGDAARPLEALRILVVEDHRDAAESLKALLEIAGHRVEVALAGPDGVEKARRLAPDAVICDIGLAGPMDGYAVARALREEGATAPALLIAMTGYGRKEDRERALEAGFDQHLVKPVDWKMLEQALATGRGTPTPPSPRAPE